MKIIVSHDVDHLNVTEHWKDLIIPKLVLRSSIEYAKGYISTGELKGRISGLFSNKLQNLEELMQFDKKHGIPSTFFVGVENGLGLSYPFKKACNWISRIEENGFDVGVHGIHFDNLTKVIEEKKKFGEIVKTKRFGIRLHYLRRTERTGEYLAQAGYIFDSSEYGLKNPYKIGGMWEFPLHMMDTYLISTNGLQSGNLKEIKAKTMSLFKKALNLHLMYFSILFHDVYYSNYYSVWKAWYEWFIKWVKLKDIEFISFSKAIEEIAQ